jgi:oxygen-independent coproporphyrinogen-3 oxidase
VKQQVFHVAMLPQSDLIKKYNLNVPRYTSYPPVPSWDAANFSGEKYISVLQNQFIDETNEISVYIHLPYCESLCTYCGCNTRITVNHSVELPYINAVLKEWEMYIGAFKKKPIITELHLGGGTPTFFSPDNLAHLINGLKKITPFKLDGDFSFEGHPNNTSFDHLKTLRNLGFNRVSFGVQDFDEKVQVAINRIQPFENVRKVINWSRDFDYKSVNVDLVYGLPFQTIESVEETINKTLQMSPDRIAYYSYGHVPWVKPGQRKFTDADIPADDYKRTLFEIGKKLFLAKDYVQIGFDHFAKKNDELSIAFNSGTLHRNFMGYTVKHANLLIGLGVSSISESNIGFAQNEKTVEGYLEKINSGNFPIIKGHLLTDEDVLIKETITQLMCNFWCEIPNQLQGKTQMERLVELENDGLIELSHNKISVTESGKPFVRNICSVFDTYFSKIDSTTEKPIYSKSV